MWRAAYATIFSQLLSGLFCLLYVLRKLHFLIPHKEDWKLSLQDLWESLRIGLPMGFQANIIALGCIIVQMRLNEFGPLAWPLSQPPTKSISWPSCR